MKAPGFLASGLSLPSSVLRERTDLISALRLLFLLAIPVCLLLPGITAFPYPSPEAPYSDLAITHYPNAVYLRQALLTDKTVPLWSPTILSGYPFAANPLSGLWYPPGWLALLLPLPFGFNLLVGSHILWGGVGFYLLLRGTGMKMPAALLAALAFESMPKVFAHYGAGHITLIYALAWTPWLLLVSDIYRNGKFRHPLKQSFGWALPAAILALIFMADVRWAAYSALLWWVYVLWRPLKADTPIDEARRKRLFPSLGSRLMQLVLLTLLAFALSAPLAVPLVEYTALSTRAVMADADALAYSLPPARLLGLFFPDLGGFHEWISYPGWVILLLGLLAVLWRRSRSRAAFWMWLAIMSLIFSLGEHLPLLPLLFRLPLLDMLRVPPRWLFLAGMAFAGLAGWGLDALLEGVQPEERKRARLLLVFLIGLCIALAGYTFAVSNSLSPNIVWGLVAMVLSAGWIWLVMDQRVGVRWSIAGLFVLAILDMSGVSLSLFAPRPIEAVLSQASGTIHSLSAEPGSYRVFSPSYSLPQQSAVHASLQLADGVDPLQLRSYAAFIESASGVPGSGYSVTLPPFQDGDPSSANELYTPNPDLLGLLNVRYVAAEFDLDAPGLVFFDQFGSTRVYENNAFRPRAWVQPSASLEGEYHPVESLYWQPNRIEVRASGPGLLVLSEIGYPGWGVWVDGEPQDMLTAASILRAVNLQPGEHQIIFRYRPLSLYLGLGLAGAALLVVLSLGLRAVRRVGDG